ncbi:hypothetical protein PAXRUDRAFT_27160 [Paxillus rubicundulus Ve08.2h10]|uniref:Uncharacterized protein n=1 Tax=Paxillus rubicundulus Ve08.2h10 TaxID=930991 RepID=A0A0D0E2N1_9AGAM|nr:hypothetical protein PAXRUDRAFT_27160 [Paxillus rubicundulus Ve08.2h10]
MRSLSVSLILLALAWSRALSVQGAPAVGQETSLTRRSGDYQGLEAQRDISPVRRDGLVTLVGDFISALSKVATQEILQALDGPLDTASALTVRAVPPSVSSSTPLTTSNRTMTTSGTLEASAVKATAGTSSSMSSKPFGTAPASSAPVTRREVPIPLPLPVSVPVPLLSVQSGSSTTSHLTSTTSAARENASPV